MSETIGFEASRDELHRLLDEVEHNIKAARGQGDDALHTSVLRETKKLVEFTRNTEPKDIFDSEEIESIRRIDELADEARRDIFGASADEIIVRIQDRASQLNQLTKLVKQQAAANSQKSKALRLVPLRNVVDTLTDTVKAIKSAREELIDQDADESAIKSKIDGVVRAISALEKAARDIGV